ncbi:MAG: PIG-L deacetylase family protein [archaeon]
MLKELQDTKNRILVISPHPDDCEFSTGRLIMRRKGKNSFVICLTDGRLGQDGTPGKRIPEAQYAKLREAESRKALKEFHVLDSSVYYFGLPDQDLVSNPYVVDKLFMLIKKINPDFVLIPPWEGAHPDHDAAHLFAIISLRNLGFSKDKIIEYGSYNNFEGEFKVQEFVPMGSDEEKLIPTHNEQKRWTNIMEIFKSQVNQQRDYFPKSKFENYRILPSYDYSKLPYSSKNAEVLRELLSSFYPIVKKVLPKKSKMFYETWASINPKEVNDKLEGYIEHYGLK